MVPHRESAAETAKQSLPAETADPSPGRLLLVDDGPTAGYQICGLLIALGWVVDCAQERAEAEALLLHRHYDAVIVDLRMSPPGPGDGLSLLAFVRAQRPQVRAVMLVDSDATAVKAEAWRLGAAVLLPRPQTVSALHRLLRELLSAAP